MTRERYFELCDLMGSEPLESEIPVEISDLPHEVQLAFELYYLLPMDIAEFSGVYRGKHLDKLGFYFDVYDVEGSGMKRVLLKIITILDAIETKIINDKRPKDK